MSSKGPPGPRPKGGERSIAVGGDVRGSILISGNANIINSVVIEQMMKAVSNQLDMAPAAGPAVDELRILKEQVEKLTDGLLSVGKVEEAKEAATHLEMFTREATSAHPRKAFLELTAQGLIGAAKTMTEMAGRVVQVVTKILALYA